MWYKHNENILKKVFILQNNTIFASQIFENMSNITQIIEKSGLDEDKQLALKNKFLEFESVASEWTEKANQIVVTEESQTDLMQLAKEGRKFLSSKRIEIEKLRKQLKDASLQEGRMIDNVAKELTALIEPTEKYLKEQETYAERMEAERVRKRTEERINLISPYLEQGTNVNYFNFNEMDEVTFNSILETTKDNFLKKQIAEQEAEKKRIEAERLEKERIEQQRLENIRLQKELQEKHEAERKLKAEQEKALAEEREKARKIQEEKDIEFARQKAIMDEELRIEREKAKQIEEIQLGSETPSQFRVNNGELTPNTILLGDVIKIDKEYFYYKNEKIEDINKVYDLFYEWLKQNTK